jgi:hypothetical protein
LLKIGATSLLNVTCLVLELASLVGNIASPPARNAALVNISSKPRFMELLLLMGRFRQRQV